VEGAFRLPGGGPEVGQFGFAAHRLDGLVDHGLGSRLVIGVNRQCKPETEDNFQKRVHGRIPWMVKMARRFCVWRRTEGIANGDRR